MAVSISGSPAQAETAGPYIFTVTRDAGGAAVSYAYRVVGSGSSPASADDFVGGQLPSGLLNFAQGAATASISIPVAADLLPESNEQFSLLLTDQANPSVTAASIAATIIQSPSVLYISAPFSDREGDSGMTPFIFTVRRTGDITGTSTATYTVSSTSASGDDFGGGVFPTGTLSFAPGETSRTISIPVAGDTVAEPNEPFTVTLSNPNNALIGTASGSTTIYNDDYTRFSVTGPGSKFEGNSGTTDFAFTIVRSGDLSASSSVNYAVELGSYYGVAQAADFAGGVLPSGVASFAPGEATKIIHVGVVGDTIPEADETFIFHLTNPTGPLPSSLVLDADVVFTTILTDEIQPVIKFTGPSSVPEGDTGSTILTYTVTRTGDLSASSTVSYSTFLDPYSQVAVRYDVTTLSPDDFVSGQYPQGTLAFAPGESSKTFTVAIKGDFVFEPDERLTIDLGAVSGASGYGKVNTTILNDDLSAVGSSLGYYASLTEGIPFSFTFTRSGDSKAEVYSYSIQGIGGSPTSADDFIGGVLPSGTISFGVGELTKTVVIGISSDSTVEASETFRFTIKYPSGYLTNADLTILDDDGPVVQLPAILGAAFSNILATSPGSADASFVVSLVNQMATGNSAQALEQIITRADATTSVATMAYEFFTGKIPSQAGMTYLVSPTGPNPNNLNSAYYQSFSVENRYINFAVNLGKVGEGAAKFAADYGALDLTAATTKAYQTIFGTAPTADKVHALLDPSFVLGGVTMTRAQYFAAYGQDGPNGIGTKAAMVGWLLAEAEKADVGTYAKANHAFLMDLADGAPFAVDLVGVYGRPEFAL